MTGLRVAVLSGGPSPEREPSLISAASVFEGLKEAGHEPVVIELGRDRVWWRDGEPVALMPGHGLDGVDVVFPMMPGALGEDGAVQGLLECLDVPYVGAGVLASALCLNKRAFKDLLSYAGFPQASYEVVHRDEFVTDPDGVLVRMRPLGLPAFVKPSGCGSSVGVTRVAAADELSFALEAAFAYDSVAIVETAAGGIEVECSVIGNRDPLVSWACEVELISSQAGWRDWETKRTRGSIRLKMPARMPIDVQERVRQLALEVFHLTHCRGLARVDFFVDGDDVLVNEVNTLPGMKPTSVFSLMLKAVGMPYPEMLDRLVTLALERDDVTIERPAPALLGS